MGNLGRYDMHIGKHHFTYSYSSIKTWPECPLSFFFSRTKPYKTQTIITPPLTIGNLAHVAYSIYQKKLQGKNVPDIGLARSIGEDYAARGDSLDDSGKRDVVSLVECFAEWQPWDSTFAGLVLIEQDIAFNAAWQQVRWMAKDVLMRSKVDRITISDDTATIKDWKTGWLVTKDLLQLQLYAFFVSLIYPKVTTFVVELVYIRTRTIFTETYSRQDLGAVKTWLTSRISEIEEQWARAQRDAFPACPGVACDRCFYSHICDYSDQGTTKKDLYSSYLRHKAAAKALEVKIRAITDPRKGGSPVSVRGSQARFVEGTTKKVNVVKFVSMMGGLEKAAKHLTVNNTSIKTKFFKDPIVQDFLTDITVSKPSMTFKGNEKIAISEDVKPQIAECGEDCKKCDVFPLEAKPKGAVVITTAAGTTTGSSQLTPTQELQEIKTALLEPSLKRARKPWPETPPDNMHGGHYFEDMGNAMVRVNSECCTNCDEAADFCKGCMEFSDSTRLVLVPVACYRCGGWNIRESDDITTSGPWCLTLNKTLTEARLTCDYERPNSVAARIENNPVDISACEDCKHIRSGDKKLGPWCNKYKLICREARPKDCTGVELFVANKPVGLKAVVKPAGPVMQTGDIPDRETILERKCKTCREVSAEFEKHRWPCCWYPCPKCGESRPGRLLSGKMTPFTMRKVNTLLRAEATTAAAETGEPECDESDTQQPGEEVTDGVVRCCPKGANYMAATIDINGTKFEVGIHQKTFVWAAALPNRFVELGTRDKLVMALYSETLSPSEIVRKGVEAGPTKEGKLEQLKLNLFELLAEKGITRRADKLTVVTKLSKLPKAERLNIGWDLAVSVSKRVSKMSPSELQEIVMAADAKGDGPLPRYTCPRCGRLIQKGDFGGVEIQLLCKECKFIGATAKTEAKGLKRLKLPNGQQTLVLQPGTAEGFVDKAAMIMTLDLDLRGMEQVSLMKALTGSMNPLKAFTNMNIKSSSALILKLKQMTKPEAANLIKRGAELMDGG